MVTMYTEKKMTNVNVELVYKKIIEMAVLKTSFRFLEINLGFVTSAWGAGHLTPKNPYRGGHLTKERARMVGNLTKKIKNAKCQGVSLGGGGEPWAPLDLTHT